MKHILKTLDMLKQQQLLINQPNSQIWLKTNNVNKVNSINILINLSLSQNNVITKEQENANMRIWDNELIPNAI